MIKKLIFLASHETVCPGFLSTYKQLKINQYKNYDLLTSEQDKLLKRMISFAYNYVPFYHRSLKSIGLIPKDIRTKNDLEKLPIINKKLIKNNWNDFIPINLEKTRYYSGATTGSTGNPFKYRFSKYDRFLSGALLYRGWGYNGYNLGDKMVFLGGSSIGINLQSNIHSYILKKLNEFSRNILKQSSFDMGEQNMISYIDNINKIKPNYIYGYASAIYLLARWAEKNDVRIQGLKAVFTTSDKLLPHMRKKITDILGCDVYDNYGLNDGGVSAFECSERCGLHIDTERSVMEIVDKDGHQLENGCGNILATSLHNFAMPFIRYDTGDLGYIIDDSCCCGNKHRLLKEVVGRSVDFLITPEDKIVHGLFFDSIFDKEPIKEYQIIQERQDTIIMRFVPEEEFDETSLKKYEEIIKGKSPNWNIDFRYVDKIERTTAGKYKIIINKISEKI